MIITTLRLHAKIYSYLKLNQHRSVPFKELCNFVYHCEQSQISNDYFPTEIQSQMHVMDLLIFLSDLQLITLNEITDQSSISLLSQN